MSHPQQGPAAASASAIVAAAAPPIDFSFFTVAPSDARELLGKNYDNRALSESIVARYAGDILGGRWALTHQAIAVGPDGNLVDGQHRLAAIIRAGVPTLVVFAIYRDAKVAEEARQKVDLGRTRRAGDVMEIAKTVERGTGKRVVSIVTSILALEGAKPWGGYTPAALQARYLVERAGVDYASSLPNRAFQATVAAAFAYAYPVAGDAVREFATLVNEKVGIRPNSAAHLYVKAADDGSLASDGNQAERVSVTHRALRLIQAHITGEIMAKVQASPKGYDYFRDLRTKAGIVVPAPVSTEAQPVRSTVVVRRPARA